MGDSTPRRTAADASSPLQSIAQVVAGWFQNPRFVRALLVLVAVLVLFWAVRSVGGCIAGGLAGDQADQAEETQAEDQDEAAEPEGDPALAWRDEDFPVQPGKVNSSRSDNGRKVVYLTIDDGPSKVTQSVLDVLDEYDCKATFFVVGHDPEYFHLIKEAYDKGHTIGLHSMTHDFPQVYASDDAYFQDLDRIGQVVREQIGYVPNFIRFPGGSSNAISEQYSKGIMTRLASAVQQRGYQYYDWSATNGDGGGDFTADELFKYATERNAGGGYDENIVMLCHDSATKQSTVEALPRIIEYYQKLGYTFEAIDRDTWVCHHAISN